MRFYSFTNFYLSSIQQGIQPAHCIADMFVKYTEPELAADRTLHIWAERHKTMICLNGGHAASIRAIYQTLERLASALDLPYGNFHEDADSLDGTMTCCGLVVPARIYEAAADLRANGWTDELTAFQLSEHEVELINLLNSFGLAK